MRAMKNSRGTMSGYCRQRGHTTSRRFATTWDDTLARPSTGKRPSGASPAVRHESATRCAGVVNWASAAVRKSGQDHCLERSTTSVETRRGTPVRRRSIRCAPSLVGILCDHIDNSLPGALIVNHRNTHAAVAEPRRSERRPAFRSGLRRGRRNPLIAQPSGVHWRSCRSVGVVS